MFKGYNLDDDSVLVVEAGSVHEEMNKLKVYCDLKRKATVAFDVSAVPTLQLSRDALC